LILEGGNMKKYKNTNILIIVGIVILVCFLLLKQEQSREEIVIHAYDSDGNLIDTVGISRGQLQAIAYEPGTVVQLPNGTASVKFEITVENTGNFPINVTYLSGVLEET